MVQPRWLLALLPFAALASPAAAHAEGSLFMVEVSTGISEPTAAHGDVGLSYGLTSGFTWKLKALPLRFALLGTVVGRNAHALSLLDGVEVASDRQDVDLYGSLRVALPIAGGLRVYGEGGAGVRWSAQTLRRQGIAGALDAQSSTPIAVGAMGLQYRFLPAMSVGLRGEVVSTTSRDDLLSAVLGRDTETARFSGLVQLGFHF